MSAVKKFSYKTPDPLTDDTPTTSRCCKTKISPKKIPPEKCAKVNRFRKILDDQARRIVRRSVHLKNDNQRTITIFTPKKYSPGRKSRKRWFNKSRDSRKLNTEKAKNISSTIEDGELRSDISISSASSSEVEDDCIVVEPTMDEITIDDNDDEEFPITTDISTNYQALMDSFQGRVSSTPCCKLDLHTDVNTDTSQYGIDKAKDDDNILPFFVDVGRGTESINSTEKKVTDYIKLTTLREKSVPKRRSVRLKDNSDDKVIELNDTSNDQIDVTLKCNSGQLHDDSVIFISETNKNDFIPIVDDSLLPHKILKINGPSASTPVNRMPTNTLFTKSETKKLNEYNENAYNPSSWNKFTSGKRMVIIDGSNVAFKHGLDQEFSVKGLQIVIEYFEKMGHEVKAVIPQFRMNKTKSSNQEELLKLHKAGKIVQTPCKNLPGYTSTSYDDRFILQLAFATDAAIVSNDNYRDLLHENPAFKKIIENRVIGYTWCNDIFILPKDPYGKWGPTLKTILNRP